MERLSEKDGQMDWFSNASRLGDGLCIMDSQGLVIQANEEFARIIEAEDPKACLRLQLRELVVIDQTVDPPHGNLAKDIASRAVIRDAVLKIRTINGQGRWILYNQVQEVMRDKVCFLASVHDMTVFYTQQEKTRENEILFRSLFTYSPHAITLIRPDGAIVLDNDKARALYTYNKRYYVNSRNIFEFVDTEARQKTLDFLEEMKAGNEVINTETVLYRRDGSSFWAEVSAKYIHGTEGQEDYIIIFSEDISDRKTMAEQIRNLAITDELTGLYNRRGFAAAANQELSRASLDGTQLALLFLDMDRMKQINDTQGHMVGDQALKSVASLLQMTFRDPSINGRWGGDEFVVLVPAELLGSPTKLLEVLERNLETINSTGARPFELSLTLGIAHFDPLDPLDLEQLVKIADAEMYRQKRKHAAAGATSGPNQNSPLRD